MHENPTSHGSIHRGLGALHILVLAIVALAVLLPGIAQMPPTDRDEARYVQATHQMVESGNFVDIHFQNANRYKKPIGIYWLQAAAVELTGHGADAPIWTYRLVSVLGGTLAVVGVGWLAAWLFGASAGLLAGVAQATIVMLAIEGHIAKTDATLLATVVFAQAALATIWIAAREERASGWGAPLVFWIATGIGILIKGPVTPLVSLLTVLALAIGYRQAGWLTRLKPGVGFAIVVLIAAPWLIAITLKSGVAFWTESVGKDLFGKVAEAQESHGAPPGFYALIFVVFIWPFGRLALRGGLHLISQFRDDPRLAFLLAWYVPYWLVVEALPTKLPQYILPVYPAVLLALAWAIVTGQMAQPLDRGWKRWLDRLTLAGHFVATLALAGAAVALPIVLTGAFSWAGLAAGIAALTGGALASGIALRPAATRRLYGAAGAAGVMAVLLFTFVIPSLTPVWLSPAIAQAFRAERPCPDSVLASAGYTEPSLVFLAGTDTVLTTGPGAADYLADHAACGIAAVTDRVAAGFLAGVRSHDLKVKPVATIEGINYSKGKRLAVTLYTAGTP